MSGRILGEPLNLLCDILGELKRILKPQKPEFILNYEFCIKYL